VILQNQKKQKDAKILWNKIMDEDKELKKWYKDFLNEVVAIKKNEQFEVSQYRKEVFVVPEFKNRA